jgi:hypothetical protein
MALWDEKFQFTEEKQCADRILDAWDDSNVCPICIQQMETGHKCDKEDAPIHDQMAYVRQAIGRSLLLQQIKRAHERQTSVKEKPSPITMGKFFSTTLKGNTLRQRRCKTSQMKATSTNKKITTILMVRTPQIGRDRNRTTPLARMMKVILIPTATIQDCD